jgi:AraC family transcriptional activator of pyochelin receptor
VDSLLLSWTGKTYSTVIGTRLTSSAPLRAREPVQRFVFSLGNASPPIMTCELGGDDPAQEGQLVVSLQSSAMRKMFGSAIGNETFHQPPLLRDIVQAINSNSQTGQIHEMYCTAKAVELLCETVAAVRSGTLVRTALSTRLSCADAARIQVARSLVETHWREKMTIDRIARSCGLNRSKLTSGYRELFGSTVAEALVERRFYEAKRQLRSSDQPIASIGYDVGYESAAAFARSFLRRYGVTPQQYRLQCDSRLRDTASSKPRVTRREAHALQ